MNKKLRFEIFKRDGFICRYCGQKPPDAVLEVDHILPVCEGGQDEPANLITSCFACNRGKGKRGLGETLPHIDELEALAALQELAERKMHLKGQMSLARETADLQGEAATLITDMLHDLHPMMEERHIQRASLLQFIDKMGVDGVRDAVSRAAMRGQEMSSYAAWRWFCGVCWTIIRGKGRDAA